jgi:hypothetical protein
VKQQQAGVTATQRMKLQRQQQASGGARQQQLQAQQGRRQQGLRVGGLQKKKGARAPLMVQAGGVGKRVKQQLAPRQQVRARGGWRAMRLCAVGSREGAFWVGMGSLWRAGGVAG